MLTTLLLGLALGALPAPAQAAPAQTPAQQAFAEANAAYEQRKNEEALAGYERALALEPNHADFHLGRARALARLARHAEAIEAASAALKLKPDSAAALRDRGHYSINLHRAKDAIPDLVRAEKLDRSDRDIYYHLALAYYIDGDFRRSAEAWRGCLRNASKDDEIISCSAWLYPALERSGQQAEAKKVLARITPEMKPGDNTVYFDRLMLFKGAKSEEEVAKTMEKDAVSKPTVAYSIGLWHLLGGRTAKAREYFEKAASDSTKYAFGAVAAEAELKRMAR